MNNMPKHHGRGPPEARGPMQLHRPKAGPAHFDAKCHTVNSAQISYSGEYSIPKNHDNV